MKYNLCSSCVHFQPRLLTEDSSIPKSCLHPQFSQVFGIDVGGFPSGIDIIHCDFHEQYPFQYGDVFIENPDGKRCSYVLTQPRNFKLIRVPKLYDNLQNIKPIKLESYGKESKETSEPPF